MAEAGAHRGIARHGLMTAAQIAAAAGVPLPTAPRPVMTPLALHDGTEIVLTDNRPLSAGRLTAILQDGLTPADWMRMLNDRVFLWPAQALGAAHAAARARLRAASEWQVYDTEALLAPVWDRAEIAPINTGSTLRAAVPRGRATFAPLYGLDYAAWRRARQDRGERAGLDRVKEVAIRGGAPGAGDALLDVLPCP